jgi:hypothetical protein
MDEICVSDSCSFFRLVLVSCQKYTDCATVCSLTEESVLHTVCMIFSILYLSHGLRHSELCKGPRGHTTHEKRNNKITLLLTQGR